MAWAVCRLTFGPIFRRMTRLVNLVGPPLDDFSLANMAKVFFFYYQLGRVSMRSIWFKTDASRGQGTLLLPFAPFPRRLAARFLRVASEYCSFCLFSSCSIGKFSPFGRFFAVGVPTLGSSRYLLDRSLPSSVFFFPHLVSEDNETMP